MATIASPREPSPNPSRITSPTIQSTRGGTPASSVRTSLDIQTTTGSTSNLSTPTTATATPTSHQRRNRTALRDYYNLKSRPSTNAGSGAISPSPSGRRLSTDSVSTVASSNATTLTTKPNSNNGSGGILPPQLDDPTFNVEGYVQDLLKTSTLRQILQAEGTLVSQVRTLDGERKALVYDNYSKLIKAVGTIGDMQRGMRKTDNQGQLQSQAHMQITRGNKTLMATGGVQGGVDSIKSLDGKLDKLISVVKEIQMQTQTGNEKDRSTISSEEKTIREQRKQQELVKWVVDAPGRLRELLQQDHSDEARKQWAKIRDILDKWKDAKGVGEVKAACEKVMETIDMNDEDEDEHDGKGETDSVEGDG